MRILRFLLGINTRTKITIAVLVVALGAYMLVHFALQEMRIEEVAQEDLRAPVAVENTTTLSPTPPASNDPATSTTLDSTTPTIEDRQPSFTPAAEAEQENPPSTPLPSLQETSTTTTTMATTAAAGTPTTTTTTTMAAATEGGGPESATDDGITAPSDAEEVFDGLIPGLLSRWNVPGAAIAIARDGKLVLARGYGLANVEKGEPVEPDSLFRIASVSKPITAVAVLRLAEEGLLDLDERVYEILREFQAPERTGGAPGLEEITVRHLLQHSGGWDAAKSYDAMFQAERIEQELGGPKPVSCRDVIRFMVGQPLDFDPGTQYAYSNFGYCLLGRIVEERADQPYEQYVMERVLRPLGITGMRIGGTLSEEQMAGEVTYYGYPGEPQAFSVMPDTPDTVPWPYGGFHLRTMDAHGGWVASAIDLVRFAVSVDGSSPPSVLTPETVELMTSRPPLPQWEDSSHFYGMGWAIRPVGDDANWWHDGSLPGTQALIVRTYHGFAWAVLFNSRPSEWALFGQEVDELVWEGVRQVTLWPSGAAFPSG